MENSRIIIERINDLAKSKDIFNSHVDEFYNKELYTGPSIYFHKKVIEMINNSKNYQELLENNQFIEYLYASLTSWGLHRMDRKVQLEDFCEFKKSIQKNVDSLKNLSIHKLHELDDDTKEKITPRLSSLFRNLKVMKKGRLLIGNSKTLHHLLPNLILPIDQHTLNFFYEEKKEKLSNIKIYREAGGSKEKQEKIFLEIFNGSHLISKKLDLKTVYFERKDKEYFTTSILKLIDNVIIGYVESKM